MNLLIEDVLHYPFIIFCSIVEEVVKETGDGKIRYNFLVEYKTGEEKNTFCIVLYNILSEEFSDKEYIDKKDILKVLREKSKDIYRRVSIDLGYIPDCYLRNLCEEEIHEIKNYIYKNTVDELEQRIYFEYSRTSIIHDTLREKFKTYKQIEYIEKRTDKRIAYKQGFMDLLRQEYENVKDDERVYENEKIKLLNELYYIKFFEKNYSKDMDQYYNYLKGLVDAQEIIKGIKVYETEITDYGDEASVIVYDVSKLN